MGLLAMDCLRVRGGLGGLGMFWEWGDSLLGVGVGFPCGSVVSASAWTSSSA